ncbi:hypothetical protein [Aeromicrobium sp. Sec7.5]|uniref:hypothetical protein n=1 Tax=Aeromicrobium sp. Sec7.5 TaxID=3121276 RepID=UPI002FE47DAF
MLWGSRTHRAAALLVAWLVAATVVTGCSGSSGGGRPGSFPVNGGELADLLEGEPISEPGDFADAPATPTGVPDLEQTKDLSTAGGSRPDAEAFAVEFLHLIVDTREETDVDEMVDELVAEDADPNTVAFFETNLARKVGSEIQQVWRTDEESWIRTQVAGDANQPDSVSVEVAFTLSLDQSDLGSWVTHRIDLVRDDDAWLVTEVTFRFLDFPPDDGTSISQALDGGGWRAIQSG